MNNLWRAFMRQLPKRVLIYNGIYYPQVWFIWWHYVWVSCSEVVTPEFFAGLESAKFFIEHNWDPITKPKKEIAWRSSDSEKSEFQEG